MIEHILHIAIHKLAEEGVEKMSGEKKDTPKHDMNEIRKTLERSPLTSYFKNNLENWLGEVSCYDCCTYKHLFNNEDSAESALNSYKHCFKIPGIEFILFARDTSSFDSRNQGVIMTNRRIHIIEDNCKEEKITVKWNEIKHIEWENDFVIYGENEVIKARLKNNMLFKHHAGIEGKEFVYRHMASLLSEMVKIAPADTAFEIASDEKEKQLELRKEKILDDCRKVVLQCSNNTKATLQMTKRDSDLDSSAVSATLIKMGYPKISTFYIMTESGGQPLSDIARFLYRRICEKMKL